TNHSTFPASSLLLVLRWPLEIQPVERARGTPGMSGPSGCTEIVIDTLCSGGESTQWNLGALRPGESVTGSYSAELAGAAEGSVVDFDAFVTVPNAPTLAPRTAVGQAVRITSARPLELGIAQASDPIAAGGPLLYALHFANTSTDYTAPDARLR